MTNAGIENKREHKLRRSFALALTAIGLTVSLIVPAGTHAAAREVTSGWPSGWWSGSANLTQDYGCTKYTFEPYNASCPWPHRFHSGMDFGFGGCGHALTMPVGGTLLSIGKPAWAGPYAPKLRLDGDSGHDILLAHVRAVYFRPGNHVPAGAHVADVGGLVGPGGSSTGCHLHFEVDLAATGRSIQPRPYLNPAPRVPGPPTNVKATPGNGQATVSWAAPASDGGTAITGYVIYVRNVPTPRMIAVGPVTQTTVTGLENGETSAVSVAAKNALGTGRPSPAIFVTPTAPSPGSRFTLTVAKSGSRTGTVTSSDGGINCGTTCAATFNAGTTVTLTATPAANSTFAGWSGACTGTGLCVLTLNADTAATARFYVRGTVKVPDGQSLHVRSGAGTGYPVIGSLPNRATVSIACQKYGTSVIGMWGATSLWDRLSTGGYVSDGFVDTGSNGQVAPSC